MVKEGDAGDIRLLDNEKLLITREFSKMVDEIVKICESDQDLFTRSKRRSLPTSEKGATGRRVLVIPVSDQMLSPHFGHCDH